MINAMLLGAIIMASLIVCLFFLRFWKSTRDRFFLFFATSFLLEAITRLVIAVASLQEQYPLVYIFRLVAYSFIIFAILDKNRSSR